MEYDGMVQMKQVLSSEEHLADELSADFHVFFKVFLTHEAEVSMISPRSLYGVIAYFPLHELQVFDGFRYQTCIIHMSPTLPELQRCLFRHNGIGVTTEEHTICDQQNPLRFWCFPVEYLILAGHGLSWNQGTLGSPKTTNNSGRCLVDKPFGGCCRKKHDIAHDQQEFVEVLLLAKCSKMLYFEGDSQPDTLKVGWFGWLKFSKSIQISKSADFGV